MSKGILLLCCLFYTIFADESIYFDRTIVVEGQEETANLLPLSFYVEEKVEAPVAIISRCAAGIVGGCCGRYFALSYDACDDDITLATVTGAITSVIAVGLLLQNQKIVRTVNNAYRSPMRIVDQLANNFIGIR